MNGLPVTPIATTSSRASAASIAVFSAARPFGPKVFGLVWSCPLSSVISAIVPALPGSTTSRECAQRDDLVGLDRDRLRRSVSCRLTVAAPSKFGFSQMTVPPMPRPTHMVVRP